MVPLQLTAFTEIEKNSAIDDTKSSTVVLFKMKAISVNVLLSNVVRLSLPTLFYNLISSFECHTNDYITTHIRFKYETMIMVTL